LVAATGCIPALVVPPLLAELAPLEGEVAIGPTGASALMIGCAGVVGGGGMAEGISGGIG
jgi:hypothetical protein